MRGGALLLHTEGSSGPSMKRLQQLAASFAQRYGHLGADAEQLMQNVFAKDVDQPEVLMPVRGHWKLDWDGGSTVLNSGDTCLVPAGLSRAITPSMTGEASMYCIRNTDDPAGPTMERQ